MTRTVTILSITAAVAILFLFTGCGRYSWHRAAPEKKAEYAVKKISSELDLTKEQREKLEKMKDEIVAAFKAARSEGEAAHTKGLTLIRKEKITRAEIEDIFNAREDQFKKLKPLIIDKIAEFHAMLTPEQREKLAKLAEEHKKRWHN